MHKPTKSHWAVVKRLLPYLNKASSFALFFLDDTPLSLHAFSDVDWVGNRDDRTSTTVYIMFLGAKPISWSSKKQKSVLCSS